MSNFNDFNNFNNFNTSQDNNNQSKSQSQSMLFDSQKTYYTSPQENFTYTGINKPSVDWDREVDQVIKEEIKELAKQYQAN